MVRVYGGLRVVKVGGLNEVIPAGAKHAVAGAMLLIILIVLLVLALGGGGWAHSRYGYAGWSPAGLLLLLVVVLWLTGNLHS
jgi:hypothetical protein